MKKQTIKINNKIFEHIKTREYMPVSIYKNKDVFLKIGAKDLIQKELRTQKNLFGFGFPVAEVIQEGVSGENNYYYIEKSLGNDLFSHIFSKEYENTGIVSENSFGDLLSLVEKFSIAQIKTGEKDQFPENFYLGMSVNYMLEELPELKGDFIKAFKKTGERFSVFPFVITHGDFNPHNLFKNGVIDFEKTFFAPAGYDLVVNIFHVFLFPEKGDFEMLRKYEFSREQIEHYLAFVDKIYTENKLPKPSEFINEFMFCRLMWSAARMHKFPKIQKWRYDLLKKVLNDYLNDRDIIKHIAPDVYE